MKLDTGMAESPLCLRQLWWVGLRIFLVGLVVLLGALIWPGWPLHWAARPWLARELAASGLEARLDSLWLRLRLDGTLSVSGGGLAVAADGRTRPDFSVEAWRADWWLRGLLGGGFLPRETEIGPVVIRPIQTAAGEWRVAGWAVYGGAETALDVGAVEEKGTGAVFDGRLPGWILAAAAQSPRVRLERVTVEFASGAFSVPEGFSVVVEDGSVELSAATAGGAELELTAGANVIMSGRRGSGALRACFGTDLADPRAAVQIRLDWEQGEAVERAALVAEVEGLTGDRVEARVKINQLRPEACAWLWGGVVPWLKADAAWVVEAETAAKWEASLGDVLTGGARLPGQVELRLRSTEAELGFLFEGGGLVRLRAQPLEFAALIGNAGRSGRLEPFRWAFGSLSIESEGATWGPSPEDGRAVVGEGSLRIAALDLAEVVRWAPESVWTAETGWLRDWLAGSRMEEVILRVFMFGQPGVDGLPGVRVTVAGGVRLPRGALALEGEVRREPEADAVQVTVRVPDFNQSVWQVAALQELGVPDVDAPLRLSAGVVFSWPELQPRDARWEVVAGPGKIQPQGAAREWVTGAVPLDRFSLAGALAEGGRRLELERMELASGRMRLSLGRTILESDKSNVWADGPVRARLDLSLTDFYAADWLPLVAPSLVTVLAPYRADLEQIGLESLKASAEFKFSRLPWVDPTPAALAADQTMVVRLGVQTFPVRVDWRDEAGGRVAAEMRVENFRPDRLRLDSLRSLPILPETLELPVGLRVSVAFNPSGQTLEEWAPSAKLELDAGPGRVRANSFLAKELPVRQIAFRADASLFPPMVEGLAFTADFDGPRIALSDLAVAPGGERPGRLKLELTGFPLDWVQDRVRPEFYPDPRLKAARMAGRLDALELWLDWPAGLKVEELPGNPDAITFRAKAAFSELSLRMAEAPALRLKTLKAEADRARAELRLDELTWPGVRVPQLTLRAERPLDPVLATRAAGAVEVDVARALRAYVEARQVLAELPSLDEWSGLGAAVAVDFEVGSPWPVPADGVGIEAEVKARVCDLVLPSGMIPPPLRVGPAFAEVEAKLVGLTATGAATARVAGLEAAPWIAGPVAARATFVLDSTGGQAEGWVNLAEAALALPPIGWKKVVGEGADVFFRADHRLAAGGRPACVVVEMSANGLPVAPVRIAAEAAFADAAHPEVALVSGLHAVSIKKLQFGPDALELELSRDVRAVADAIALRVRSVHVPFWLGLLVRTDGANAAADVSPKADRKSVATAPPAARPEAPLLVALPIPDLRMEVVVDEVVLGGGATLLDSRFGVELRSGYPATASLRLHAPGPDSGGMALALLPPSAPNRAQAWTVEVENIGGWAAGVWPALSVLAGGADASLAAAGLSEETFYGGRLEAAGTVDWRASRDPVKCGFAVRGLELRKEIEFLSRIAALVKRRVILGVPFKTLDFPELVLGPDKFKSGAFLIDGPINLNGGSVLVDFDAGTLDLLGKVMGVGFQVVGPFDDLKFFLSDKNAVIQGLTTADDFEW